MPLLRRLMNISCRLTEAVGGSISIVECPGQRYTKIAERGTACRLGQSFPLHEGVTGQVMACRRPVVLDAYRDIATGHLPLGHPARDGAVAAIPIWWRGEVVGVNVVFAGCARPFTTTEIDQLEVVTQLAAPGITTAAGRELSLAYLGQREPLPAGGVPGPAAGFPDRHRGDTAAPSVAEVALELTALGERAGIYQDGLSERLNVAVVREGGGLHLLTPGRASDLREVGMGRGAGGGLGRQRTAARPLPPRNDRRLSRREPASGRPGPQLLRARVGGRAHRGCRAFHAGGATRGDQPADH